MTELALYNRFGRAVHRLCGPVIYDYAGKPRGFVAGRAVYDLKGQHRGFWQNQVIWDRMGRVLGYAEDAQVPGLELAPVEIPPVPYKNLPAPEPPAGAVDRDCPALVPAWSMMRLENLLPA